MNAAYYSDAYLRELTTEVVEVRSGGLEVVLADTVLYPTGGGQPHDRGWLCSPNTDVEVTAVRSEPGAIVHELAEPWPQSVRSALVRLDWSRRFDHMQQHTAQHVLSALAEDRFGWKTTAFHLGERICDVELAAVGLKADQLRQLEHEVVEVFRQALPVSDRWLAPEDLEQLTVRSRGLPEGHRGLVRLVEIEGVDRNTCGGTHLRSTAEAETLAVLGTEEMRGGTRLYWVAGGRVRDRLADREELLTALRSVLEGADEELESLARKKKEQSQSLQRELRAVSDLLIEERVQAVLMADSELVTLSVDPLGGQAVSRIARSFAQHLDETHTAKCLLVVSSAGPVALATADGSNAQTLGQRLIEELGVRGGGKGAVFQGKVELASAEATSAFLSRAAAVLQELLDSGA